MSLQTIPSLPADFSFSQSSLQDYFDCPRRFQLRYLDRLAWPAMETEPMLENERRMQEGQSFHRLVQQHLIGLPADKVTRFAVTTDLRRWWENYIQSQDLQDVIMKGRKFPELTLSAPISRYRLQAKYDLVIIDQERKILIIDWKTFRRRPRDESMAARLQTRVYPSLFMKAGSHLAGENTVNPDDVTMMYWYTDFPLQPARFSLSSEKADNDWNVLTALVDEIADMQEFTLTEDTQKCLFCPYRSYCDRGKKAGTDDEAEMEDFEGVNDPGLEINREQVAEIEF